MRILLILLSLNFLYQQLQAASFIRDLPNEKMREVLIPENFPDMDAIIVLNEQSYQIFRGETEYQGQTFIGPNITTAKILIVKLFNETAVNRYGSFEFVYNEYFGFQFPHIFEVNVRVLKPNGKKHDMSGKETQKKVIKETKDGTPLVRSVTFKVPDLQAGDILQIEYLFTQRFSRAASRVFYYNEPDLILFSNLYITFPREAEVEYLSYPQDHIGQPQATQVSKKFGAGETYFWSLRNVPGVPKEPFSFPVADQSMLTAFCVKKWDMNDRAESDWPDLAKFFYKEYIDQDKISNDQIASLGFSSADGSITSFEPVDQLYTRIRKKFTIDKYTSLYPASDDIKSIFEKNKGDASDLAYILYKILKPSGVNAKIVWIRDQREGEFKDSVPTMGWFDRLGVLVEINSTEKLYEFDRSAPENYRMPWYLKPVRVVIIEADGHQFKKINSPTRMLENKHLEIHNLKFAEDLTLNDQISLVLEGEPADRLREICYGEEDEDLLKRFSASAEKRCLTQADSVSWNDFQSEPGVKISLSGKAATEVEALDNYLTFKLHNQYFTDFKEKIFSTIRHTHVNLSVPSHLIVEWNVALPSGYAVKSAWINSQIQGPAKSLSEIIFTPNGENLKVALQVAFPDYFVNRTNFGDLIKFLDQTQAAIGQDIVLEKLEK